MIIIPYTCECESILERRLQLLDFTLEPHDLLGLGHNRHSFLSVKIHLRCQSSGYGGSSKVSTLTISPRNLRSSLAMHTVLCFCSITTKASQSSGVMRLSPHSRPQSYHKHNASILIAIKQPPL